MCLHGTQFVVTSEILQCRSERCETKHEDGECFEFQKASDTRLLQIHKEGHYPSLHLTYSRSVTHRLQMHNALFVRSRVDSFCCLPVPCVCVKQRKPC